MFPIVRGTGTTTQGKYNIIFNTLPEAGIGEGVTESTLD